MIMTNILVYGRGTFQASKSNYIERRRKRVKFALKDEARQTFFYLKMQLSMRIYSNLNPSL